MKRAIGVTALAMMVSAPMLAPTSAFAQRDDRRYERDDRNYRGRDGRQIKCGSGNGAVGTIAGGVGGGLLGSALGGGTLGTIAGAGGGALLGRHFDKKNTASKNRKNNGC
ncbi:MULTISPECIES: hypothetical protein [unclassified Sphingomonas]|uniref:hypothetical protein n=1 Tax=unclassified Sphingomonas TaxID=196159 RepID=UPI001F56CA3B|nr:MULTISPECIES: hypothetical protein [unclassified Sphingomonas]